MLTLVFSFSVLKEQKDIYAQTEEDVVLHCLGPKNATIKLLKWVRADLKEGYVYFYRVNKEEESLQLPLFRGRVKRRNPEMKDGDFSLTLKQISINDTGTYECFIGTARGNPTLYSVVHLYVDLSKSGVHDLRCKI